MSSEHRAAKSFVDKAGNHRRDYSLGREWWAALDDTGTTDGAATWIRCECGALITFDTNGDGRLVALEARTRERHECEADCNIGIRLIGG